MNYLNYNLVHRIQTSANETRFEADSIDSFEFRVVAQPSTTTRGFVCVLSARSLLYSDRQWRLRREWRRLEVFVHTDPCRTVADATVSAVNAALYGAKEYYSRYRALVDADEAVETLLALREDQL